MASCVSLLASEEQAQITSTRNNVSTSCGLPILVDGRTKATLGGLVQIGLQRTFYGLTVAHAMHPEHHGTAIDASTDAYDLEIADLLSDFDEQEFNRDEITLDVLDTTDSETTAVNSGNRFVAHMDAYPERPVDAVRGDFLVSDCVINSSSGLDWALVKPSTEFLESFDRVNCFVADRDPLSIETWSDRSDESDESDGSDGSDESDGSDGSDESDAYLPSVYAVTGTNGVIEINPQAGIDRFALFKPGNSFAFQRVLCCSFTKPLGMS